MEISYDPDLGIGQMVLRQNVGIAIQKKVMESAEQDSQAIRQMLERSLSPNVGANIDIRV